MGWRDNGKVKINHASRLESEGGGGGEREGVQDREAIGGYNKDVIFGQRCHVSDNVVIDRVPAQWHMFRVTLGTIRQYTESKQTPKIDCHHNIERHNRIATTLLEGPHDIVRWVIDRTPFVHIGPRVTLPTGRHTHIGHLAGQRWTMRKPRGQQGLCECA